MLVVTGENAEQFEASAAAHRKQLAFYGSTPAYRKVLELHGWGDLHTELHRLSRLGEWDTMATLIDDEVLAAFGVVAELPDVADALVRRCAGAIDRVLPGFPAGMPETVIAAVLDDVRECRWRGGIHGRQGRRQDRRHHRRGSWHRVCDGACAAGSWRPGGHRGS